MNMFAPLFWMFAVFVGIAYGMNYQDTWSWVAFSVGVLGAIILREMLRFMTRKL